MHRLQWSQGPVAQVLFYKRDRKKEKSSTAQVGVINQWKVPSMLYLNLSISKRLEKKILWWSMSFSSDCGSWRMLHDSCSCDGVREMSTVPSTGAVFTLCNPLLQPEEPRDLVKHFHISVCSLCQGVAGLKSTSNWGQAEGAVISERLLGSWIMWISQSFPWCQPLFALVNKNYLSTMHYFSLDHICFPECLTYLLFYICISFWLFRLVLSISICTSVILI